MFLRKKTVFAITAALMLLFPVNSFAQFEAADAKVFISWPELEVDPGPGRVFPISVYAIIDGPLALYTLTKHNRFNTYVMGSFFCNQEFSVLKTQTNGFYDIRCVDKNIVQSSTTYLLHKGNSGGYVSRRISQ